MYKLISDISNPEAGPIAVLRLTDNASIPLDPANTDYAAYLQWLSEGNTPLPAPEPEPAPVLTTEQKLEAAGLTVAELKELFGLQ